MNHTFSVSVMTAHFTVAVHIGWTFEMSSRAFRRELAKKQQQAAKAEDTEEDEEQESADERKAAPFNPFDLLSAEGDAAAQSDAASTDHEDEEEERKEKPAPNKQKVNASVSKKKKKKQKKKGAAAEVCNAMGSLQCFFISLTLLSGQARWVRCR